MKKMSFGFPSGVLICSASTQTYDTSITLCWSFLLLLDSFLITVQKQTLSVPILGAYSLIIYQL